MAQGNVLGKVLLQHTLNEVETLLIYERQDIFLGPVWWVKIVIK